MRQYMQIKEKYEDCILFFRLGDFYEMFFDDAKTASAELDLTLTGRDCGLEERAPMCGVPYHSCEAYIARLIEKGYRVAICEQTEDPATAKGIVNRDIVRIITPGTVIEDSMLDESKNNYLAAVYSDGESCGVAFVDVSTGTAEASLLQGDTAKSLKNKFVRYRPSELITNLDTGLVKPFCDDINCCLTLNTEDCFAGGESETDAILKRQFAGDAATEILSAPYPVKRAVAAALIYLRRTQMGGLECIRSVDIYADSGQMQLDSSAVRNLELVASMRDGGKRGSLLWVLDKTRTAPGRRLIRTWIEHPLTDKESICRRHDAVEELSLNNILLSELRDGLTGINDIERLMTRIVFGTAGARELRNLCNTLRRLPPLKNLLAAASCELLANTYEELDPLYDVAEMIDAAIVDSPPFSVREGGMIKEGYNSELDLLGNDYSSGAGGVAALEERERELTGIKNLKIRYNKVIGYYIEVLKSNSDKVPERYIRKSTVANSERYITEELKDLESRMLGNKERRVRLEYEIFCDIRKRTSEQLNRIKQSASAVALCDVLCSLANVAVSNGYCRPIMNDSGIIDIKDGRHPVVELMTKAPFVPNDTYLDKNADRCAIITGPNMAGKSTYMRQVALIALLAQIGSFVPASSASLPIVDSIFTRVGASDDLSTGRSTFMVEMSEVAYILCNATSDSLIILDEIGRGTSTYDGMSIARAVLEYVCSPEKIGAKTLFATHYHELTALEDELDGVKNYNIAVKKRGDDITFLRRIVRGGADESYGIEVAKLSGIPDDVIARAKTILSGMENCDGSISERQAAHLAKGRGSAQLSFVNSANDMLAEEIKAIDVNTLTPIEAMSKLYELVNKARES